MLDVHILTLPTSNKQWLDQCLASVEEARAQAGYEVNVHIVPGVRGHMGKARKVGYAVGNAPWKTYVDDDDYVLPHAFSTLGKYLDRDVVAICPREHMEQNGILHPGTTPRHHLITFRSEFINGFPWDDWLHFGDVLAVQTAIRHPKGILEIDDALYVHRVYLHSAGRRMRRKYPDERIKLAEMFNEPND